jgi:phosphate transport system protein
MRTILRRTVAARPPKDDADDPVGQSATVPLDLDEINRGVAAMFAHVPERLEAASEAFLSGDREAARGVVETDPSIDALQNDIEVLVQDELVRQPLTNDDLRYLVTVLRIVPELERSADLVEHIALRTQHALIGPLSPRARTLIERMSALAVEMWCAAASAFDRRDAGVVVGLRALDDQIDDLHVELTGELAIGNLDASVAIELGLVARFFERLGDHAVNVTARLAYIDQGHPDER